MLSVLARRVSSGRLCGLGIRVCVSSPPGGAVPSRKIGFMVTVEAFHLALSVVAVSLGRLCALDASANTLSRLDRAVFVPAGWICGNDDSVSVLLDQHQQSPLADSDFLMARTASLVL